MLFLYNKDKNYENEIFKPVFLVKKKGVTSGGSRFSFFFKNKNILMRSIFKRLTFKKSNKSGRNSSGKIVLRTRKSFSHKNRFFKVNYSFRHKNISFISSIVILPFLHKLFSLVFLSSGSVTYIPSNEKHKLFLLTRLCKVVSDLKIKQYVDNILSLNRLFLIEHLYFLLYQLPRNKPISLLEVLPGDGVKYVRSPGSKAYMNRKNYKLNTGLVKLPSGVRKIFSTLSLASEGENPINNNKLIKNNKAGYYSNFGRKSMVRGVAKNPVDHPHGGRTKTLKWPRTP